jgi:hypothetical protein
MIHFCDDAHGSSRPLAEDGEPILLSYNVGVIRRVG